MSVGVLWPSANCVRLYHLENVNDSSGGGYTLSNASTSAIFENVKFGVGARFPDATSELQNTNSTNISVLSNFTAVMWVYTSATVYFFGAGSDLRVIRLSYGSTYITVDFGGTETQIAVGAYANKINCIIITVDAAGTLRLYFNGVYRGSAAHGSKSNNTTGIRLGASNTASITLKTDEVAIYNICMSEQWIRRYYAWATGKL